MIPQRRMETTPANLHGWADKAYEKGEVKVGLGEIHKPGPIHKPGAIGLSLVTKAVEGGREETATKISL